MMLCYLHDNGNSVGSLQITGNSPDAYIQFSVKDRLYIELKIPVKLMNTQLTINNDESLHIAEKLIKKHMHKSAKQLTDARRGLLVIGNRCGMMHKSLIIAAYQIFSNSSTTFRNFAGVLVLSDAYHVWQDQNLALNSGQMIAPEFVPNPKYQGTQINFGQSGTNPVHRTFVR